MAGDEPAPPTLRVLIERIAAGDSAAALDALERAPDLGRAAAATGAERETAADHFLSGIGRHIYAGDTALHLAAAAHQGMVVDRLIAMGADLGARNRLGAAPLHSAVDAGPGFPAWDPAAQSAVVTALLCAGADPNAADRNGATPLHRAVRNRCSGAVAALLAGGADPQATNTAGSTPHDLAHRDTGRGGAGSPEARAEQRAIQHLLGPPRTPQP